MFNGDDDAQIVGEVYQKIILAIACLLACLLRC